MRDILDWVRALSSTGYSNVVVMMEMDLDQLRVAVDCDDPFGKMVLKLWCLTRMNITESLERMCDGLSKIDELVKTQGKLAEGKNIIISNDGSVELTGEEVADAANVEPPSEWNPTNSFDTFGPP